MSDARTVHRVLQVHTRYRQAGGEDQVVDAERGLLEEAGIEVSQVIFDNADLRESRSFGSDLQLAASVVWSRSAGRRVGAAIASHHPQIMHVHNTFPAASPSVYGAAARLRVPIVQTLHNYRFVCPAATAFRDGHACTDCVGRPVPWPAVLHACVRGSHSQSLIAAAAISTHRTREWFSRAISGYVALTSFQRHLMIEGGLPAGRIRVIPNFLEPDPGIGNHDRRGFVFLGRLAPEKGVAVLIDAASTVPGIVRIIGDGPMAPLVARAGAAGDIAYLGSLPRSSAIDNIRRAIALILPSVWFEGFPLVLLEAFAAGTPAIASRIGSLAELIEDGSTGLLVEPNNARDLAERIRWASDHPREMREMGAKARRQYETRFRGARHLAALLETYKSVLPAIIGQ